MKIYDVVVRSGLTGNSVRIGINIVPGVAPSQSLVFIDGDDDPIGATTCIGWCKWSAVTLPDGHAIEGASSRFDAARDIVQHLSDHEDPRLDLEWREAVTWSV